MRPLILIGILLVLAGILVLGYQGFTYVTREKVVDVGPVQVTAEREHFVFLPPVLGAAALASGVLLIYFGTRQAKGI